MGRKDRLIIKGAMVRKKKVVVTGPFPSVEKVARLFGMRKIRFDSNSLKAGLALIVKADAVVWTSWLRTY